MKKIGRRNNFKKSSAFSLVEIAIAIIVIGIILTGVIKGKELINQSRLQGYSNDFGKFRAHLALFKDSYSTWPSDVTTAECTALGWGTTCSATSARAKTIDNSTLNYFWHQLESAYPSFVIGEEVAAGDARFKPKSWTPKASNDAGRWEADYNTGNMWAKPQDNYIISSNSTSEGSMRTSEAKTIDLKIDDGKASSGAMYGYGSKCSASKGAAASTNDYGDGSTGGAEDEDACAFVLFLDDWE